MEYDLPDGPVTYSRRYTNVQEVHQAIFNGNRWQTFGSIPTLKIQYQNELSKLFLVSGVVNGNLWFGFGAEFTETGYEPFNHLVDQGYQFSWTLYEYHLRDSQGNIIVFHRGGDLDLLYKKTRFAGGSEIVAGYNESLKLISLTQSDGSNAWAVDFEFVGSGVNFGVLQRVVLKVDGAPVRACSYTYYEDNLGNGMARDLKTATRENAVTSTEWETLGVRYYRYYRTGEENGFHSGLKFVVGEEGMARLVAAEIDYDAATDEELAPFADYYFEYDAGRRVVLERAFGGTYELNYSYAFSGFNPDGDYYNIWMTKTTELRPNGSRKVVFLNGVEQILATVEEGEHTWATGYRYDDKGRLILKALPSAIALVEPAFSWPLLLNTEDGLVKTFSYYDEPGDGWAPNRLKSVGVKRGESGEETLVRFLTYTSHEYGGQYVFEVDTDTTYQSDNAEDPKAAVTSFEYEWYPDSLRLNMRATTLPIVSVDENGTGTAFTKYEVFDKWRRPTWRKDELGYIERLTYDSASGGLSERVEDAGGAYLDGAPEGWEAPDAVPLNKVTAFSRDPLGRVVSESSGGRSQWTVYKDAEREVWKAFGEGGTAMNPVAITKFDGNGDIVAEIGAIGLSMGVLQPTDFFPQSSWIRWRAHFYGEEANDRLRFLTREYFAIPASGEGTSSNFNEMTFKYDNSRRLVRRTSGGGTIYWDTFDMIGRNIGTWVGTNDEGATAADPSNDYTAPNNMRQTLRIEYDGGGVGDGFVTEAESFVNDMSSRIQTFEYDFRDRRVSAAGPEGFCEVYSYDNLDRRTLREKRSGDPAGVLLAKEAFSYDGLGQNFKTERFEVDPSSGSVGNSVSELVWFDGLGRVIKKRSLESGGFEKSFYDGLGRTIRVAVAVHDPETEGDPADSLENDFVLEQTDFGWSIEGDLLQKTMKERNHNATGTGPLNGPAGDEPRARVSYTAFYPDYLGRTLAVAEYGTNGGSPWTRSGSVPARSDTCLVKSFEYNERGEMFSMVDSEGIETRYEYDDLGRLKKQTQDYEAP